ncbi:flagellar basal body L-ring protein FlgH, partial [Litorivivens sp.]
MKRLLLITILATLAACSSAPDKEPVADNAEIMSTVREQRAESAGSIYMASRGLNLFLDRRARQVGDSITVTLLEQTDASKQSSTSTAKEQSNSVPGVTLFGRGVTKDGIPILETS